MLPQAHLIKLQAKKKVLATSSAVSQKPWKVCSYGLWVSLSDVSTSSLQSLDDSPMEEENLSGLACRVSEAMEGFLVDASTISLDKALSEEDNPSGFKCGVSEAMEDVFLCVDTNIG
ncbi:hypothetical protein AXX17_AT4G22910 [Arabidopsis thaliana]|uniref:Uncharacterized protein n=1 Tax=Arabidopsis thaliana TaxID=3702 RepID=A0A178UZE2_ARATH|nr:hypothetical protein AXX17_AT4G22910 [Arabidopsis thaliana]